MLLLMTQDNYTLKAAMIISAGGADNAAEYHPETL